jgi:hypothetical protein
VTELEEPGDRGVQLGGTQGVLVREAVVGSVDIIPERIGPLAGKR